MAQVLMTAAQTAGNTALSMGAQAASAAGQFVVNSAVGAATTMAQNLIFGPQKHTTEGPQIDQIRMQGAQEGTPIPRIYGRMRIAGQIIWATNFKETVHDTTHQAGGKGVQPAVENTSREYQYSLSLAIGLCAGEVSRIGQVWADGQLVNLADYNFRLYHGNDAQQPDALIETIQGSGNTPAYRGLAYIVFEDLPLKSFGNRIPQFNFEVFRRLDNHNPYTLENLASAVTLIPASGEAAYDPDPVAIDAGEGVTQLENVHSGLAATDFIASIDDLQSSMPNCKQIALIVSWFGTDLRAGQCKIQPAVERDDKTWIDQEWQVSGVSRDQAFVISQTDGKPNFGGTPSDASVKRAIQHLKARGFEVLFYPFIMMDIPAGNGLTDPYGGAEQAPFPWRGRITANEVTANAEITDFIGTAQPNDFPPMATASIRPIRILITVV